MDNNLGAIRAILGVVSIFMVVQSVSVLFDRLRCKRDFSLILDSIGIIQSRITKLQEQINTLECSDEDDMGYDRDEYGHTREERIAAYIHAGLKESRQKITDLESENKLLQGDLQDIGKRAQCQVDGLNQIITAQTMKLNNLLAYVNMHESQMSPHIFTSIKNIIHLGKKADDETAAERDQKP